MRCDLSECMCSFDFKEDKIFILGMIEQAFDFTICRHFVRLFRFSLKFVTLFYLECIKIENCICGLTHGKENPQQLRVIRFVPISFVTMCWFKLRANESGCAVMEMLSPKQRCSLIGATESTAESFSIIVTRRHNHLPYALYRMEMELIYEKKSLYQSKQLVSIHMQFSSLSPSLQPN